MNRAGKEPAEDVMRRIVAACEEAGLTVDKKQTSLQHRNDGDFRVLWVSASPPDVPAMRSRGICFSVIHIETIVGTDGRWSEKVGIKCDTNDAPLKADGELNDPYCVHQARMHGRSIPVVTGMTWEENPGVRLPDLVTELRETLRERKLVQAALANGEKGPWQFGRSFWEMGTRGFNVPKLKFEE
jgi:hypothetical protein